MMKEMNDERDEFDVAAYRRAEPDVVCCLLGWNVNIRFVDDKEAAAILRGGGDGYCYTDVGQWTSYIMVRCVRRESKDALCWAETVALLTHEVLHAVRGWARRAEISDEEAEAYALQCVMRAALAWLLSRLRVPPLKRASAVGDISLSLLTTEAAPSRQS